jgi:hypothetical protein
MSFSARKYRFGSILIGLYDKLHTVLPPSLLAHQDGEKLLFEIIPHPANQIRKGHLI